MISFHEYAQAFSAINKIRSYNRDNPWVMIDSDEALELERVFEFLWTCWCDTQRKLANGGLPREAGTR